MKIRLALVVAISGLTAMSATAQGAKKLAVGPDAGGYYCPDGRQLYVKSCYSDAPQANCGVINVHLPIRHLPTFDYQEESTITREQILASVGACTVVPVTFNNGVVSLAKPKNTQTAATQPVTPPNPPAIAKPQAQAAAKPAAPPPVNPAAPPRRTRPILPAAQQAFDAGEDLYGKYDTDGALAAYAKAAKLDPTMKTAWLRQADIYVDVLLDFDMAAPLYEKALALDPSDDETADSLCTALYFASSTSGAVNAKGIHYCEQMRTRKVDDFGYLLQRLESLYEDKGDNAKWLAINMEWTRAEPTEDYPWQQAAKANLALGKNQDALTAVNKALTLKPETTDGLNLKGKVLLKLGRPADAIAAYRQSVKVFADLPETHAGLAEALRAGGQKAEADAEMKTAIATATANVRDAIKDKHWVTASIFLEQVIEWDKVAGAKLQAEFDKAAAEP